MFKRQQNTPGASAGISDSVTVPTDRGDAPACAASGDAQVLHLDVRGLEPPEPMERVLDALAALPPDSQLGMLIEREPRPLYPILAKRGYAHATTARPDLLYEVRIWRRADAAS